jgi:putative phosphoribosyl transferase
MVLFSPPPFKDRRDAGRQLADALEYLKPQKPVVLALPRGGVPVAYEVAQALGAPLDVLLVRKIGAPGQPELGLGAVVDGQRHQRVLNQDLIDMVRPPEGYIEAEERRQLHEIERRRKLYCGTRPPVPLEGRTVIVVDDGIATGGTMKTALAALSSLGVGRLVLAVPVAPRKVLESLSIDVDESICLLAPEAFRAVSPYYADFDQTTDEEVIGLLNASSFETAGNEDNAEQSAASAADLPIPPENQRLARDPASQPPGGRS